MALGAPWGGWPGGLWLGAHSHLGDGKLHLLSVDRTCEGLI